MQIVLLLFLKSSGRQLPVIYYATGVVSHFSPRDNADAGETDKEAFFIAEMYKQT